MALLRVAITALFVGLLTGCPSDPGADFCGERGIVCPSGTRCAAAQAVCITNECGDAVTQTTEACDDGNIIDGDGCSADCKSTEDCGDGVLNVAAQEICDDHNTVDGDGCSYD
ncbi:MAG: DUF4215 domain-containing protein, partial [Kofleriaceae bacterium]